MAEEYGRVLVNQRTANRLTRRAFLTGSTVAAVSGGFLLSACGNGSTGATPSAGGASSSGAIEGSLNMYNWAEYDDPKLYKQFQSQFGPTVKVDVYASNEEMIAKLVAANGTSGFDTVCPTGPNVPQMIQNGLLEELDLSRIPNFSSLDTVYTNQSFDPGNKYTICKDWGSTGWIYDKRVVTTPIKTWSDFFKAAEGQASRNVSVLDAAVDFMGMYFWANGIDWNTTNTADLDAAQSYLVDTLAPHIKNFDSYPGIQLTKGNYALSQVWNGDARQGLLSVSNPEDYVWGLGYPKTELWMDNWAIVKNAPDINAAYAWINFIMDPTNSFTDVNFHGYNTGIKGLEAKAKAAKMQYFDMIFFPPSLVSSTMVNGIVNEAQQQQVDILEKAKAKASA